MFVATGESADVFTPHQNLLCSGDALDIDGDEVTLEYAWYTGATEDSLSLSNVTTSTYTVGASILDSL